MTRYELHCKTWADGCGSSFCDAARKKTFFRGTSIPVDILFCGEAPGKSEAVAGIPFAPGAPAGRLLTHMIQKAIPSAIPCPECKAPCFESPSGISCKNGHGGLLDRSEFRKGYSVGFTNLVACIPRLEGEEKIEPDPDQITLCKPRLEEIIDICQPKLIFAVGSQSRDALTQGYLHSTKIPKGCTVHHIVHPAWILRQTTAFQGLEIQRVVCQIQDAIYDYEKPPKKALTPAPVEIPPKKGGLKPKSPTPKGNYGIVKFEPGRDYGSDDDIPF